MSQNFQNLLVWRRSHLLAVKAYRATQRVSRREYPGLVSQLRRAATSVPANIAEGCGRSSPQDFGRFLQMAMASAAELEYHLILAEDLAALPASQAQQLRVETTEIKRMLTALIQRVRGEARAARPDVGPTEH